MTPSARADATPVGTGPSRAAGVSTIEVIALTFSLAWLALVGWFFLTLEPEQARLSRADPLGFMMTILGVFLPVALVWVAAAAARAARTMREESARLQAAIDAMRLSYLEQQRKAGLSIKADMEGRLDEVARAQAVLGAELAAMQSGPETVLEAPARPETTKTQAQARLALDEAEPTDPLPPEDFIRALHFPRDDRDTEGFAVLRRALEHPPTARVVTAAQDVLTLLSQDGIYMDDLVPDHADPVVWRAFADGARGAEVSALGGIRDRSSIALAAGRMQEDSVFRDSVHQFLRVFDAALTDFAASATDRELLMLADSRSGRAFMMMGRVARIFG